MLCSFFIRRSCCLWLQYRTTAKSDVQEKNAGHEELLKYGGRERGSPYPAFDLICHLNDARHVAEIDTKAREEIVS